CRASAAAAARPAGPEAEAQVLRTADGSGRAGAGVQRRLPVWRGAFPPGRHAGPGFDLPLPDVPEGVWRLLRAAGRGGRGAAGMDPWRANPFPVVERGAARILRRLRHAADLRVAGGPGPGPRRLR